MATLVQRINDLAGSIRDKINLMVPRLLPAGGATGQALKKSSATNYAVAWTDDVGAIEFVIDGGGVDITGGVKGDLEIPFACQILGASIVADAVGSIVVDIWKDTYANFPPTVADTITAAQKPTLASAQKAQNTTLTGWTTSIAAGDWLRFNVDSATGVKRVTVSLKIKKT